MITLLLSQYIYVYLYIVNCKNISICLTSSSFLIKLIRLFVELRFHKTHFFDNLTS